MHQEIIKTSLPLYHHEGGDAHSDAALMRDLLALPSYRFLEPIFDTKTGFPIPTNLLGEGQVEAWHSRGLRVSMIAGGVDVSSPLRLLAAQAHSEGVQASVAFAFAASA